LLDAYGTLFHYERARLGHVFQTIAEIQKLETDPDRLFERWTQQETAFRRRRVYRDEEGEWHRQEPFRPYKAAWTECFVTAFRETGLARGDPAAAVETLIRDLMDREAFAETMTALDALRARVQVGILSNADERFLTATLAHNGIEFETMVCSEQEKVYKPHPLLFERALERLDLEPSEVIYAGDSPTEDIVGATAAGIVSVWVNRDGADWPLSEEERPSHEVTDLLGLVDIVSARVGDGVY
jgi:2-haloalkanoic acid dehalogenase type II